MAVTAPLTGPVGSPPAPITIQEFALHCGTGTPVTIDAKLTGSLAAAIGYVEDRCGPIAASPVAYAVEQAGSGRRIVLPVRALAEVTHLIDCDGCDTVDMLTTEAIDWAAGIITAPYHRAGTWVATVVTATTVHRTAQLTFAALSIGKHIFDVQRSFAVRNDAVPGGTVPSGFIAPRRATQAMEPHLVNVGA